MIPPYKRGIFEYKGQEWQLLGSIMMFTHEHCRILQQIPRMVVTTSILFSENAPANRLSFMVSPPLTEEEYNFFEAAYNEIENAKS